MALAFYFPLIGTPTAEGNLLSFYEAGTNVPLSVWTDSDLTIPWNQPIVLNSAGESDGPIYLSSTPSYKTVYTDGNGVAIAGYPVDMITPSSGIINLTNSSITSLTNAQLLALPTTPIILTLTASQIANLTSNNLRIAGIAATLTTNFSAGAYTNVNTTFASLQIETTGGTVLFQGPINKSSFTVPLTRLTTFFGNTNLIIPLNPFSEPIQAGTTSGTVGYTQADVTGAVTDSAGLQMQISMDNNGSGNLTGGNAANTLLVTVYFALESLT